MLSLQQNLKLLTIQYQLSMLIGQDLNLTKMLGLFIPKASQLLNCVGAYVWLKNTSTGKLEAAFFYPSDIINISPDLLKIIETFTDVSAIDISEREVLYLHDDLNINNYLIPIDNIGLLLLQRREQTFSQEILCLLKPILNRLAIACRACMQYMQTESLYENIFQHSPVSLWEQDYSAVLAYLDHIKKTGINLDNYFDQNPQEITKCLQSIVNKNVNIATLKLFKAESEGELFSKFMQIFILNKNTHETLKNVLIKISNRVNEFQFSLSAKTLKNDMINIIVNIILLPGYENYSYVLASISDVTELMKAGEALEFTSTHDQLTNLPNRTLYNESLKAAINRTKRMRKPMALLYIDIDHFKKVNDTFGHEVGDLLLIDVAQRLSECIRKDDILARLGGDELAVILNDLNDPRDAGNIAAHLLKVISQPFQISNHVINTTLSIGIAIYQEGSDEPGIMNKHADIALYQAKSAGRNNYQYYSPTTPSTLA